MSMINYNDPNSPWLPPGYDPYKGMSDEERENIGCMHGIITVVFVIILFALMALFSSCTTTRYVPVVEHKTDTVRVNHTERDSIYFADSIYVSDFVRDDTVWRTEYKWQTKYVLREVHDTTYISNRDSIPVPYEVTKEVPAPLTRWQTFRLHLANILLYTLAIIAVMWVCRKKLKS